jgi:hydroxymethylbilane synthase
VEALLSPLKIATRGSALALWQAGWVKRGLEAAGVMAELVVVETQGDREQKAFRHMTGQGFFTKAVQDAVLSGRADVAVHSLKDLPSQAASGSRLAAVTEREDPRDVLLARPEAHDPGAPELPLVRGAKVGTSAARRQAQLRHLRADLCPQELRGNVPTRVEKLRRGDYDAVVLAAAGIKRLGLDLAGLEVTVLEPATFVPAPGQGALALECRGEDERTAALLASLHAPETAQAIKAERGLMTMLEGGCQLALGAYARLRGDTLELLAWLEGRRAQVWGETPQSAAAAAFAELRPAKTRR